MYDPISLPAIPPAMLVITAIAMAAGADTVIPAVVKSIKVPVDKALPPTAPPALSDTYVPIISLASSGFPLL